MWTQLAFFKIIWMQRLTARSDGTQSGPTLHSGWCCRTSANHPLISLASCRTSPKDRRHAAPPCIKCQGRSPERTDRFSCFTLEPCPSGCREPRPSATRVSRAIFHLRWTTAYFQPGKLRPVVKTSIVSAQVGDARSMANMDPVPDSKIPTATAESQPSPSTHLDEDLALVRRARTVTSQPLNNW